MILDNEARPDVTTHYYIAQLRQCSTKGGHSAYLVLLSGILCMYVPIGISLSPSLSHSYLPPEAEAALHSLL